MAEVSALSVMLKMGFWLAVIAGIAYGGVWLARRGRLAGLGAPGPQTKQPKVLARLSLSRTTSMVTVKVGDQIWHLAVSEQGGTSLLGTENWDDWAAADVEVVDLPEPPDTYPAYSPDEDHTTTAATPKITQGAPTAPPANIVDAVRAVLASRKTRP